MRTDQLSPEQQVVSDRTVAADFEAAGVRRADPPPTQDTQCFPHGQNRESNFHANVRLEDVANVTAHQTLQQLDAQTLQQAIVPPVQDRDQQLGQDAGRGR